MKAIRPIFGAPSNFRREKRVNSEIIPSQPFFRSLKLQVQKKNAEKARYVRIDNCGN
jgi:hypothetical protein